MCTQLILMMSSDYKGMLPCFFHGSSCFFVARSSKSSQILALVSCGRMMSSIKPIQKKCALELQALYHTAMYYILEVSFSKQSFKFLNFTLPNYSNA